MKVLCVCPRFAPANSADSHRLRLLLPHLVRLGCRVEVLAVEPADIGGPQDRALLERLPADLPVHRVRAWRMRGWGWGGLAQRALLPLQRAGDELLARGRFDLVFFSTTEFLVHVLGPRWHRRFGVPFCMDYQDPWVNDYYRRHPEATPPGGRLKYGIKSRIDAWLERRVATRCGGFLAVSAAYLDDLQRRYGPDVARRPQRVEPFPGEPQEFQGVTAAAAGATRIWRYVGRGGSDMATACRAFFGAWRQARDEGCPAARAVRFEAIGTSYAGSGAAPTVAPWAVQAGLEAQVSEQTGRVGYAAMLRLLAESEALIVFGSDDPAYTASKIYPYLLSGRPVLAIFHEDSSVAPLIRRVGGAVLVTFNARTAAADLQAEILASWFRAADAPVGVPLDRAAFEPFTAAAQARRIAQWWEEIVRQPDVA